MLPIITEERMKLKRKKTYKNKCRKNEAKKYTHSKPNNRTTS